MLFAVHAYDGVYGGLHGMNEKAVIEVAKEEEAVEIAEEMSMMVIENYDDIYNTFVDEADFNGLDNESDEWYEYIEDQIKEDIDYEVYKVKENNKSLEELNDLFLNDSDDFIKKYCIEDD